MGLSRRQFIRNAGLAGLAAATGPALLGRDPAAAADKPRVIVGKGDGLIINNEPQQDLARRLIDEAMIALTKEADAKAAWASLFRPEDVVGLKINALGRAKLPTHPEVTFAVADALQEIGVPKGNLIIWDQWHSLLATVGPLGYQMRNDLNDVRCFASNTPGMGPGYIAEPFRAGTTDVYFAKALTEQTTAVINLPVLKHHNMAGVTFALKNHYGSIKNPGDLHPDNCVECADLNAAPAIREKERLIIGDALWGCYDGTAEISKPDCIYEQKAIIVGRNPVATDLVARQMIDRKREEQGLEPTGARSRHIDRAAELGLGPKDLTGVEVVEISA